MKGKLVWPVFSAMVGVLITIVGLMFGVGFTQSPLLRTILLPIMAVFFLLGMMLLVLTVRAEVRGMLKGFLLLTGASSVAMPVFVLLHNVIGGVAHVEEPVSFLIAVFVCPVAFLVGALGSIVLRVEKSRPAKKLASS